MKILKNKSLSKGDILYGLLFTVIIAQLLYRWVQNQKHEELILAPSSHQAITEKKSLTFPTPQRSLVIFWATWCTPCKVEMNRLKSSVESGKIKQEQIIAINPFESETIVKNFLQKEYYPFLFISDENFSRVLEVNATPTTVLMNGTKVHSVSTGLSLFGIWRAEFFLNKD